MRALPLLPCCPWGLLLLLWGQVVPRVAAAAAGVWWCGPAHAHARNRPPAGALPQPPLRPRGLLLLLREPMVLPAAVWEQWVARARASPPPLEPAHAHEHASALPPLPCCPWAPLLLLRRPLGLCAAAAAGQRQPAHAASASQASRWLAAGAQSAGRSVLYVAPTACWRCRYC